MRDHLGRQIDYMRISITDRCNLRCRYCMPEGVKCVPMEEILTLEECAEIAAWAASLGVSKIKVTGGEPLVRLGCCDFIRMLKDIKGIEKVTITTNGILLERYLEELIAAGVDGINISLDTLDPKLYRALTGGGDLEAVLRVLEKTVKIRGDRQIPVKINAVSLDLKDMAGQLGCRYDGPGWQELLELAVKYPIDVRFIEVMPIGYGRQYRSVDHDKLLAWLTERYPDMKEDRRIHGNGPAVYYQIPGFQGSVGLISALHGKFCSDCNRVRLTSQGYLKSCLCYEDGVDLRKILRGRGSLKEKEARLLEAMTQAIWGKPTAHCFEDPEHMTEHENMVRIGG